MATDLTVRLNIEDPKISYENDNSLYLDMNVLEDYLIWTGGSDDIGDKMTHEPTESELNAAAVVIKEDDDTFVPLCLLYDHSQEIGDYFTHEVKGMGENERFVFCFSFNGPTATEPVLEAWDDENHETYDKHVLGNGTPGNSMIKAVCTTSTSPGDLWTGIPIAGPENVLELNDGVGAIEGPVSAEDTQDLYANIKLVIPQDYPNPAVENFSLMVNFTYN